MCPELIQACDGLGWTLPTPVQAEAVPLILGGGDVMVGARPRGRRRARAVVALVVLSPQAQRTAARGRLTRLVLRSGGDRQREDGRVCAASAANRARSHRGRGKGSRRRPGPAERHRWRACGPHVRRRPRPAAGSQCRRARVPGAAVLLTGQAPRCRGMEPLQLTAAVVHVRPSWHAGAQRARLGGRARHRGRHSRPPLLRSVGARRRAGTSGLVHCRCQP